MRPWQTVQEQRREQKTRDPILLPLSMGTVLQNTRALPTFPKDYTCSIAWFSSISSQIASFRN